MHLVCTQYSQKILWVFATMQGEYAVNQSSEQSSELMYRIEELQNLKKLLIFFLGTAAGLNPKGLCSCLQK